MFGMHKRKLIKLVDREKVKAAIAEAEASTTGEIRVSVASFFWGDVHLVAERAFVRLGMANTKERNGVLIFVVPARKRFVIIGDEAIHRRVGQEFWDRTAAAISERFKRGDFTGGLVHGIQEAGRELAAHFPRQGPRDVNQLPDDVDFGDEGKK